MENDPFAEERRRLEMDWEAQRNTEGDWWWMVSVVFVLALVIGWFISKFILNLNT